MHFNLLIKKLYFTILKDIAIKFIKIHFNIFLLHFILVQDTIKLYRNLQILNIINFKNIFKKNKNVFFNFLKT